MNGSKLAIGAAGILAAVGAVASRRRGSRTSWPSARASLECLCADDFGACHKDEEDWTEDDRIHAENFDETVQAQEKMELLVARSGLEAHVDLVRSDDRDSCHQDCYVRFDLRDIEVVVELLDEAGLVGDVLDLYDDDVFDRWANVIEKRFFWSVELSW